MTEESEPSTADDEPESAGSDISDVHHKSSDDNIQSLTDFFDQMDRAAFKRALANRDALRQSVTKPPKSQRG